MPIGMFLETCLVTCYSTVQVVILWFDLIGVQLREEIELFHNSDTYVYNLGVDLPFSLNDSRLLFLVSMFDRDKVSIGNRDKVSIGNGDKVSIITLWIIETS